MEAIRFLKIQRKIDSMVQKHCEKEDCIPLYGFGKKVLEKKYGHHYSDGSTSGGSGRVNLFVELAGYFAIYGHSSDVTVEVGVSRVAMDHACLACDIPRTDAFISNPDECPAGFWTEALQILDSEGLKEDFMREFRERVEIHKRGELTECQILSPWFVEWLATHD